MYYILVILILLLFSSVIILYNDILNINDISGLSLFNGYAECVTY